MKIKYTEQFAVSGMPDPGTRKYLVTDVGLGRFRVVTLKRKLKLKL